MGVSRRGAAGPFNGFWGFVGEAMDGVRAVHRGNAFMLND